jgi:hypothetical protein
MPATTTSYTQPAAGRRAFAFTNPLDGQWQNQPTGEVPSYQYRDDEMYTPPPANYIQQQYMQPTQEQLPAYLRTPPPAPPPPP